jgi:hypothetical protein
MGVRKPRDNSEMSNSAFISSNYVKIVCNFKSILRSDYYSEEE